MSLNFEKFYLKIIVINILDWRMGRRGAKQTPVLGRGSLLYAFFFCSVQTLAYVLFRRFGTGTFSVRKFSSTGLSQYGNFPVWEFSSTEISTTLRTFSVTGISFVVFQ